jgi:hypothetical protein
MFKLRLQKVGVTKFSWDYTFTFNWFKTFLKSRYILDWFLNFLKTCSTTQMAW